MSAVPPLQRLPERPSRVSMLGVGAVVELLTLAQRTPERAFDVSEGGVGVLSQDPIPAGSLVLAVIALPGERRPFDVIVRVAWVEGNAMGLEFLLPEDDLLEAIRRLRRELAAA